MKRRLLCLLLSLCLLGTSVLGLSSCGRGKDPSAAGSLLVGDAPAHVPFVSAMTPAPALEGAWTVLCGADDESLLFLTPDDYDPIMSEQRTSVVLLDACGTRELAHVDFSAPLNRVISSLTEEMAEEIAADPDFYPDSAGLLPGGLFWVSLSPVMWGSVEKYGPCPVVWRVYDRTGRELLCAETDFEVTDDGFAADGKMYITKDGTLTEAPRTPFVDPALAGTGLAVEWNEDRSIAVLRDANGTPCASYTFPADSGDRAAFLLGGGCVLVQYTLRVAASGRTEPGYASRAVIAADDPTPAEGSYDLLRLIRDPGSSDIVYAYDTVHSFLLYPDDGSLLPIELPGLVQSVASRETLNEVSGIVFGHDLVTGRVENIAFMVTPEAGIADDSCPTVWLLGDDGAASPWPEWVAGQSDLPLPVSGNRFVVNTFAGQRYLCAGDGTVLLCLNPPQRYEDESPTAYTTMKGGFYTEIVIYDYNGAVLLDLAAEGLTILDQVSRDEALLIGREGKDGEASGVRLFLSGGFTDLPDGVWTVGASSVLLCRLADGHTEVYAPDGTLVGTFDGELTCVAEYGVDYSSSAGVTVLKGVSRNGEERMFVVR